MQSRCRGRRDRGRTQCRWGLPSPGRGQWGSRERTSRWGTGPSPTHLFTCSLAHLDSLAHRHLQIELSVPQLAQVATVLENHRIHPIAILLLKSKDDNHGDIGASVGSHLKTLGEVDEVFPEEGFFVKFLNFCNIFFLKFFLLLAFALLTDQTLQHRSHHVKLSTAWARIPSGHLQMF